MSEFLSVSGLCSGYGRIPILTGIDFAMREGEYLGILGHNGMGKTTLMRTLMGQLPATAGRIVFEGVDVTALKPHRRSRLGLGLVPQGREIFADLTVLENLRMGLVAAGREDPSILDAVLEDFPRLKRLLDRRGGALSGGEQQLLALARCLCTRPRLVLLDEPTEGIQPSIIKDIGRALEYLRGKGGMAILLVEQYFDFARDLADRYAVLDRGEVVISGTKDEVDPEAVRAKIAV